MSGLWSTLACRACLERRIAKVGQSNRKATERQLLESIKEKGQAPLNELFAIWAIVANNQFKSIVGCEHEQMSPVHKEAQGLHWID
ncbi:hypothetical protein TNCV_3549841 [Trichonephila clavipes]|nr:hypothetical protein TNCV_3549841 [Trichonephila clavipes]